MFVELTEFLRCPAEHPETHCVLATAAMVGRDVVKGVVGCPACQREYSIHDGVARFGDPPDVPPAARPLPDPSVIQALLGISSPGGYLVLIGSAAGLAAGLANALGEGHLVAINAPQSVKPAPGLSLLTAASAVPLRGAMARGVVLGQEFAGEPWVSQCGRVLLPGLRMVVLAERAAVNGLTTLAAEDGMWVGQKGRSEK